MDILTIIIITLIFVICYLTYVKLSQPKENNIVWNNVCNNNICTNDNKQNETNIKLKSIVKKHKREKIKEKKVKFNLPKKKDNKKDKKKEDLVFIDIGDGDSRYHGKIIIRLFSDIVPNTCDNFRQLCETKKYYNSPFHRIIKDFMIQGGDFTKGNGTGGESIFGRKFPDENFEIPHDRPYLLSMANSGPNTNGSQFFITTNPQPHLNGKHVVFGEIVAGYNIIDELNEVQTNGNNRPLQDIKILNCGLYDKKLTKINR